LGREIACNLRLAIHEADETIIFLERFIHLQLFALAIAVWLVPSDHLSVWLLYRRDTHTERTRALYKWLNRAIACRVTPDRLKILTDSELLGQSLAIYFDRPVAVMPIPHTELYPPPEAGSSPAPIRCWWAGSPRPEKGWERIQQLAHTPHERADRLCLVAAQSAQISAIAGGIAIEAIADTLSREDYLAWLSSSDFLLLPYDADAYRERTSGIFTECIIAGKIPLVAPQTWMAGELARYGLADLAIDWQEPQGVIEDILRLFDKFPYQSQLDAMQSDYQQRHNADRFAECLQHLYSPKNSSLVAHV
jgi:hypothetical protein